MTSNPHIPPLGNEAPVDPNVDLGFGSVVARESRKRFLNRDGSFNVRRDGLSFWEEVSPYHYLLTISWRRFLLISLAAFLIINIIFALAYLACGADALGGAAPSSSAERFADAFFFSVDTFATIGYGSIYPKSRLAHAVVTAEAFVGILAVAVVTGFVFARFARPRADILFSTAALVAPYRDMTALMFRIANRKNSQIVELQAKVLLSRRRPNPSGGNDREFLNLPLERERVSFFPLSWTIVHPIEEKSPLFGATFDDLRQQDAEFLVLLSGFDETYSQTVHTRSSYKFEEVVFNARFRNLFRPPTSEGELSIDVRELHSIEKLHD